MTDNPLSMTWPQYLRRECTFRGKVIKLTKREVEVLSTFMMNHPRPITIAHLIESLYHQDDEPESSINVIHQYITFLRRKLGKSTILIRKRIGYVLNFDE